MTDSGHSVIFTSVIMLHFIHSVNKHDLQHSKLSTICRAGKYSIEKQPFD